MNSEQKLKCTRQIFFTCLMDLHEIMIWKSKSKKILVIVVFQHVLAILKRDVSLPVGPETAGSWGLELVRL